jgi:hypothetical protein
LNDDPVQRLERCPIEHTPSDLYPDSMMSADQTYCLNRAEQGLKLNHADTLAAMAVLDMCELCSDYTFCLKRRRHKVSKLKRYVDQNA